jgi:spermidine/putrescine-binding protein
MIVQIIRYIFEQYKSNTVEEIITHFKELKKNTDISIEIDIFDVDNDIWKKEIKQILEQDIIDICNKRTIKNLVETVIDIQKVEKELLSAKSLIDNCEKNCLDFITELSKGTA